MELLQSEPNNPPINKHVTNPPTFDYNADPITNSASFKYKSSIIERTPNNDNNDNDEIKDVVPLKHLSNFWRALNMPLVNCEVNLILTWPKNCVLTELVTTAANATIVPPVVEIRAPTGPTFTIRDTKLYVPVVSLSAEIDNKFL